MNYSTQWPNELACVSTINNSQIKKKEKKIWKEIRTIGGMCACTRAYISHWTQNQHIFDDRKNVNPLTRSIEPFFSTTYMTTIRIRISLLFFCFFFLCSPEESPLSRCQPTDQASKSSNARMKVENRNDEATADLLLILSFERAKKCGTAFFPLYRAAVSGAGQMVSQCVWYLLRSFYAFFLSRPVK